MEHPAIAVLGAGSIGLRHLQNLRTLGVERLVCFEPDPVRREDASRKMDIPFYADMDAIWESSPEAVVIAAPTQYHRDLAQAAVQRNIAVFVEKPLAHSFDGLDALVAEAEQKELVTMVGCNMRFHPGPATVKRLLETEPIGHILWARLQTSSYLPRWRPSQDYRQSYSASSQWGGAILDCIHEIDLALWFFGAGELIASAIMPASSLGLTTDGLAELLVRHQSGSLSSLHLDFMQHDYRRGCQISGTRGSIYWDFQEKRVWTYDALGKPGPHFEEPPDWDLNQMYLDEMAHFLECVRTKRPTVNPLRSAAETLNIALAARDSRWRISDQ